MTTPQRICFLTAGLFCSVLFAVMNYMGWKAAYTEFNAPSEIRFDHSGYSWGWPFDMYYSYTGFPSNEVGFGPGLIFNFVAFLTLSAILGVVFIYVLNLLRFRRGIQD